MACLSVCSLQQTHSQPHRLNATTVACCYSAELNHRGLSVCSLQPMYLQPQHSWWNGTHTSLLLAGLRQLISA